MAYSYCLEQFPGQASLHNSPVEWATKLQGTRLQDYVITKQLGAGINGTVFAAYAPEHLPGVPLAIKRTTKKDRDAWFADKFQSLRSFPSSILPVLTHFRDAVSPVTLPNKLRMPKEFEFFVFERFPVTLHDFMDSEPSKACHRKVYLKLREALTFAHAKGIAHGDIHEGNVLIAASADLSQIRVALTDWEYSKIGTKYEKQNDMTELNWMFGF